MPEAVQDKLIVDMTATGAGVGGFLRRGFRVVGVTESPAVCAALREGFPADLEDGRLRVFNRAVGGMSRSAAAGSAEGAGAVRPIDWPDLQLLVGTPYYLRIGATAGDQEFLASMFAVDTLPATLSVRCDDVEAIDLLQRLGFVSFKLINEMLRAEDRWGEMLGRDLPAGRWLSADAASSVLLEIGHLIACETVIGPTSIVCHARMEPPD